MSTDAHHMNYIESTLPEDMTLGEYRRARTAMRKPARKGPRWFPLPRVRVAYA